MIYVMKNTQGEIYDISNYKVCKCTMVFKRVSVPLGLIAWIILYYSCFKIEKRKNKTKLGPF